MDFLVLFYSVYLATQTNRAYKIGRTEIVGNYVSVNVTRRPNGAISLWE